VFTEDDGYSEPFTRAQPNELENFMNYLLPIFAMLVIAVIILMAGIIIFRQKEQTLRSASTESLAWGAGFFFSYSTLILVFELLPSRQFLGVLMS